MTVTCDLWTESLLKLINDQLSSKERLHVLHHLSQCAACRADLALFLHTSRALSETSVEAEASFSAVRDDGAYSWKSDALLRVFEAAHVQIKIGVIAEMDEDTAPGVVTKRFEEAIVQRQQPQTPQPLTALLQVQKAMAQAHPGRIIQETLGFCANLCLKLAAESI